MLDASWFVFLVSSLVIISSPGQDMMLVMSRSIAQGTRAGLATAAGVSVGLLGHTLLATFGLGALLKGSDFLFVTLKLIGAAYLVWLGIGLLRTRADTLALGAAPVRSTRRLFLDGALSNLSNPKIAIFYFAFLPQFVAADAVHPAFTIFLLGLVFASLTFIVKGPVAVFAGRLAGGFRARPKALLWLYRSSGMVMLMLGVRLALSRRD